MIGALIAQTNARLILEGLQAATVCSPMQIQLLDRFEVYKYWKLGLKFLKKYNVRLEQK